MADKEKIKIGHKKVKELDGGIYDNLKLLREALNVICETENITKPEQLEELNNLFSE